MAYSVSLPLPFSSSNITLTFTTPTFNEWLYRLGGLLLLWQIISLLLTRFKPGLSKLPGPFLAKISNLDRLWSCARGQQMIYHLHLHKKYGPIVRIGPNHVSFSDASLIPQVYGITSKFYKSDFYSMFDIKTPAGPTSTIFSSRDPALHKDLRRPVAAAYSLSTLKELEPMNDECSAIFLSKLDEKVGKDVDVGQWLHWYAFDVIMSITFSNRLGFMEKEEDVENIIAAIEGRLVYNALIGQAAWLHPLLLGNPFVAWFASFIPSIAVMNSSKYIIEFTARQLERYHNKASQSNTANLPDLLDRFKRVKDGGNEEMDDSDLLNATSGNIFAGSDTTAATLRAIIYNLCLNPTLKTKLLNEIDTADGKGELSNPVTFAEAQNLPYLQAVIKEGLRIHPAVGQLLERVVPSDGAGVLLGDVWLPPGTVVGMNPWVAARDTSTYGCDAYAFRPERWLEADEEQLKLMERNFLSFGAGTRTCLGKNISLLEMSKLLPQVLRRFDFELSSPGGEEWKLLDYWFVRQTGLWCRVIRR